MPRVRGALPAAALTAVLGVAAPTASAQPAAGTPGHGPRAYVVVLADSVDSGSTAAQLGRARGFAAGFVYRSALRGFSAHLNDRQVEALRADPRVTAVTPDSTFTASATQSVAAGDSVQAGIRRIGAASSTQAHLAADSSVAVLDTGV